MSEIFSLSLRVSLSCCNAHAVNHVKPTAPRNSAPVGSRKDKVPEWDFEIKKKSMNSWARSFFMPINKRPVPLLETYYSSLDPGGPLDALTAKFSQTLAGRLSDPMPDEKGLQRIKILSPLLHGELELITSSVIVFPVM